VQAAPPLAAEAAGSAQHTEPEPAGGGSTKKDKERQRKERQRQRKVEEAWEALRRAVELLEETTGARGVDAVEEAMQAAAGSADGGGEDLVEQARAAEAERARVAAEEAAAAAAVEAAAKAEAAAERLRLEQDLAGLTLRVESDVLRVQHMQAQLGVDAGGTRAPPGRGGDTVRVVHGCAQESRGAAVHAHVRV
jgi:hypothetical protein